MSFSSSVPSPDAGAEASAAADTSMLYDIPGPGDSVSFWGLAQTLWAGKWLILGLALLAGSTSYAYWRQQPKQYRTTSVLLLKESEQLDRLNLSLPGERANHTERDLYFLRHSQVFAETVARRLADSIASLPVEDDSFLRTAEGNRPGHSVLASTIRNVVTVKRGSQDVPALKIRVTSTHPAEAALVTNTYAQSYLDHLRRSSSARLRTSRQFLERQKRELKRRLRAIEDTISATVRNQGRAGLLAVGDSSGTVGIVGEARQIASEISDLRLQREKIQLELDVEQTLLDSARARLGRIRPNLAERASSNTGQRLKQMQQQIASLQTRIQQIQIQNEHLEGDLRAEVERLKTRLERYRKTSRRLADRYVREALSTDAVDPMGEGGGGLSTVVDLQRQITDRKIAITTLKARRAALTERIETRKAALRKSPDRALARLKRRKQTTEELFVALSKSLQKIRVSTESTPQQAQILQRAERTAQPIGPSVRQNVLLAFLFGGAFGGGLVIVYERTDDRIDDPVAIEEMEPALFGVVPYWGGHEGGQSPFDDRGKAPPSVEGTLALTNIAAPCSSAAEAYRHLATNLRLGLPTSLDMLLVTSPGPREGKSTTTLNLGVALSEAGQNVLLVDADLYGATLHRQLEVDRAPGLSDGLAKGTEAVQTILSPENESGIVSGDGAPASHPPRRGRLGLLPSGSKVPQPSLLLQEDPIQSLFRRLRADWDLLLLDTPPILAYDAASRLAVLSDVALLVAASNDTTCGAYAESADRLGALFDGPIVGLLNRYSSSPQDVYGYSSYASAPDDGPPLTRAMQHTRRGLRWLATGR